MAQALTEEQKARKALEAKAKKLDVVFTSETTDDELTQLISDMEAKIAAEEAEKKILEESKKKALADAKKTQIVLKDTLGNDVDPKDYFFWNPTEELKKHYKDDLKEYPPFFNKTCGYPVDREELIEVFHRVFKPGKGFLFYRLRDREVYLVIVPLKNAMSISSFNESSHWDFQRHAISFITEGSANADVLLQRLKKVAGHSSIGEK